MTSRIASFPNSNGLIAQSLQLQADYNTTSAQASSGLKAQYFSGISGDTKELVNLSSQYQSITNYGSNITHATNKLNVIQDVVSSINDLLSTVKSQLTSIGSGTNGNSNGALTTTQANSWKTQLASLLNTQYAGEYLFGGSVTDTAPVNLSAAGYAPTSFSTADTGYYQGNSASNSVRASKDLTVTFGITANNSAFEQVFRSLSILAADPTTSATITSTQNMISSAFNSVADMSSDLTTKINILNNESQMQSATLEHLSSSISSLRDVDIAAASANLSQLNTQLQASYSALALVLKMNLSTYLR
ncbi:MAG: hypothetical protein B7X02_00435 [Rhodospirillales bacterium 12-54-5]|nr:MAG: hypothetical protein B7X02_00435 [Rhodospirillales bacterium 12-54-5]